MKNILPEFAEGLFNNALTIYKISSRDFDDYLLAVSYICQNLQHEECLRDIAVSAEKELTDDDAYLFDLIAEAYVAIGDYEKAIEWMRGNPP